MAFAKEIVTHLCNVFVLKAVEPSMGYKQIISSSNWFAIVDSCNVLIFYCEYGRMFHRKWSVVRDSIFPLQLCFN